ncbi:MAG: uroporphyrinogen-III synthase [Bacteroidota bacterium]
MSLRSRTILVTRPRRQAGEMVKEIEKRGGTAVVIPLITIAPPASWRECDDAIRRIRDYDAIVFTSVNAVEGFFGRAVILGLDDAQRAGLRTIAVGNKTAEAVRTFGARVDLTPPEATAVSLASSLGKVYEGTHLLFPCGTLAREETTRGLRNAGAAVDQVIVYTTTRPEGLEAMSIMRRILGGEFDVLTFASPSAAENFASLFDSHNLAAVPDHAKIAVIGPTTADAIRDLGLPVDMMARESTARGLVQCIDDFYN